MDSNITLIESLGKIEEQLARLVAVMAQANMPEEPAYSRALEAYQEFDWMSIGAEPVEWDNYGAAVVRWAGYEWSRKTSNNKYGKAILFSRHVGREGKEYLTLIKFKTGGEVSPPEFELPSITRVIAAPPAAPARPRPDGQPAQFVWDMEQNGISEQELKNRLRAAGIRAYPPPSDMAAYDRLKDTVMAR